MSTTSIQLEIEGVTCTHCMQRVEKALLEVAGVSAATIDPRSGRATVLMDPKLVKAESLVRVVAEAGYKAQVLQPTR